MISKEITQLHELPEIARWILKEARHPVVLIKGEMGAGKTTLVKAIARELDVQDEVSSPTFSLVNEYLSPQGSVYHFDFYRLDDEDEAQDIGLYEYLDSGRICLIEWPEKIRNLIPRECSLVRIRIDGNRRIYDIIQPINE